MLQFISKSRGGPKTNINIPVFFLKNKVKNDCTVPRGTLLQVKTGNFKEDLKKSLTLRH